MKIDFSGMKATILYAKANLLPNKNLVIIIVRTISATVLSFFRNPIQGLNSLLDNSNKRFTNSYIYRSTEDINGVFLEPFISSVRWFRYLVFMAGLYCFLIIL